MRKAEVFFDAITSIKEELVDAALDHRFRKKTAHWRRYVSMAACLALAATVGFAALRMGVLRGMGGSSKNAAADTAFNSTVSSTTASSSASGAAPGAADKGGPQESIMEDSAAETPSCTEKEEQREEPAFFAAAVLEVSDAWILVEPLEGEEILASADRFLVSTAGVEELPKLSRGDEITVFFTGFIREAYPAQIDAVAVELLRQEPGENKN